jgi:ABC-type multidrug transport system fused ATPase/permease subunit
LAAASEAFAILETPTSDPAVPDPAVPDPAVPDPAVRGSYMFGVSDVRGAQTACKHDSSVESIVVENVSVRHDGRAAAAPDGVSLMVEAGRVTTLAGPSGCGKSTLLAVLLGFTQPDEGRIMITARGVPRAGLAGIAQGTVYLRDLDPDGWRSMIGWVPQDPTLFPGTVADNIRLGWPQAPDSAVQAAARAAALDDIPLDAALFDRGTGLSAGQRRRVAFARALLPRPGGTPRPVLLLDEPTAGLDPVAEARVIETLRREAASGRAILVASHHPAVLAAADEIVRLGQHAVLAERAEVLA